MERDARPICASAKVSQECVQEKTYTDIAFLLQWCAFDLGDDHKHDGWSRTLALNVVAKTKRRMTTAKLSA